MIAVRNYLCYDICVKDKDTGEVILSNETHTVGAESAFYAMHPQKKYWFVKCVSCRALATIFSWLSL